MTVTVVPQGRESYLGPEKMRVLAFLHIPKDASVSDARKWLCSRVRAPKEVITAIVDVHLEDEVLKAWRSE